MDVSPTANGVFCAMLGAIAVINLFQIYISLRQIKIHKTTTEVPKELAGIMTQQTFDEARIYGLEKLQFSIYKALLMDVLIVSLELYFGVMAILWELSVKLVVKSHLSRENEIVVTCMFVQLISIVSFFKDLPFKVYETFVLEARHGFNKQTVEFFVLDQVKKLTVSHAIITPTTAFVTFIVLYGGDYFFIFLWIFLALVCLLFMTIYPIFIAPLFDKYTPLDEGPLRQSIEEMAESLEFPLDKIYVVDGSNRSSHSNAYFSGLWNSKRIVIYDTLLNKGVPINPKLAADKNKCCTDEEVLAVLGHEFGHWKLNHYTKYVVTIQILFFLMSVAFGYLIGYAPLYKAVGFKPCTRPVFVGCMIIHQCILRPFIEIINIALVKLSRHWEFEADEFARKLGLGKELESSLVKFHLANADFLICDWMYASLHQTHPTLQERLDRVKENEASDPQSAAPQKNAVPKKNPVPQTVPAVRKNSVPQIKKR